MQVPIPEVGLWVYMLYVCVCVPVCTGVYVSVDT